MPYRTFSDSSGDEWQVWDVVPQLNERRHGAADRRVQTVPISFADRRRDARRLSSARRTILRGSYAYGWLCFDNGAEKRRLTPIPTDWTTCRDPRLREYLREAAVVAGAYPTPDSGDGDSVARAG